MIDANGTRSQRSASTTLVAIRLNTAAARPVHDAAGAPTGAGTKNLKQA
jgi:hypothetical protein